MKDFRLQRSKAFTRRLMSAMAAVGLCLAWCGGAEAQSNYKLRIYRAESYAYPFVQVYFRTFDQDRNPLVNLNVMNIGIMVQGNLYDAHKGQYWVQTLENLKEPVRAVLVIDASMAQKDIVFPAAIDAATSFIDEKRPEDQIAILAVRDEAKGYAKVSDFERDRGALGRRLQQIKPDSTETRLYDAVAGALETCAGGSQGGVTTDEAEYIPNCSILIFSDGSDGGSAAYREELTNKIAQLSPPVPIYSFAVPCNNPNTPTKSTIRNLQSLSNASFGKFYDGCGVAAGVQNVHTIMRNDYVVTFRSYLPVDGNSHKVKVGVEYPSGTGRFAYDETTFEANQALPVAKIQEKMKEADAKLKKLPDGNPYSSGASSGGGGEPVPQKTSIWERFKPFK